MNMQRPVPKYKQPPKEKKRGSPKDLEDRLARWLDILVRDFGLPPYTREYHFAMPYRAFRADFAWPEWWVIIEVEGGTYGGGKHATGAGIDRDMEKHNLAHLMGWTVYRVSTKMLRPTGLDSPYALHLVRRIFNLAGATDPDLRGIDLASRRYRRATNQPGDSPLPRVYRPRVRKTTAPDAGDAR